MARALAAPEPSGPWPARYFKEGWAYEMWRVLGLGFWVDGLGVYGLGFRVRGSGFKVQA